MNKNNIFKNIPDKLKDELFETIISNDKLKLERIVSHGHTTQEFECYDQDSDEWVILLKGNAIISFEDEDDIELHVGDYLNITRHKKHKVTWTAKDEKTIWLALHY